MTNTAQIPIRSDHDIIVARMSARELAKQIGFSTIDQARIATTVSELARNIVLYASSGTVTLRKIQRNMRLGLEIICADRGPGIEDVERAMQDGASTSGSLGMGLPGAKRLMDEFDLRSQPGHGTTITCLRWRGE